MSNGQYSYALDTTGTLAANKVTEEFHTITAVNGRDYHFLIPKFAPFFAQSVRLYAVTGSVRTPLTENLDWLPSLIYQGATSAAGHPIYGAISFTNLTFSGQVVVEYQTLGGEYTLDAAQMTEIIANTIFNPRGATWEEIAGLPSMFPPADHPWDYADMVGQSEVVAALTNLANIIQNQGSASLTAHIQNLLNPHHVTKNQIGLNKVENFGPATVQQAVLGQSGDTVITPVTLYAALDALGLTNLAHLITLLEEHLQDINNPHQTTKAGVGLPDVENLPIATPGDIVAKRRVKKYVTLDLMMDWFNMYGCKTPGDAEENFPPKGALISTYCDNAKKFGVYANGAGGTDVLIIEVNSRDCGYVPPPSNPAHPPKNTLMTKYCTGFDEHGVYADGYGGTYSNLIKINSENCNYIGGPPAPGPNHPAQGTILSTRCEGTAQVKVIANGAGGSYEERVQNSPACTNTASHPPAGTLIDTYCEGYNQRGRYADGSGGTYTAVVQANSADCGYIPPTTPPPTTPSPTNTPAPTPVVTMTASKSTVAEGTTYGLTINATGLPPGASAQVAFMGTRPDGTAWDGSGANRTVTVSSNGSISNVAGEFHYDASARGSNTRFAVITINGVTYRSPDVQITMLASSVVERPIISVTYDKTSIAVSQSATMKISMGNLTNGKAYRVNMFRRFPQTTTVWTFQNTVTFTASKSTHELTYPISNDGDMMNGAYTFFADIDDVRSQESSIQITSNKSVRLTIGSQTVQGQFPSGSNLDVRVDLTDFPITGKSGVAGQTQGAMYENNSAMSTLGAVRPTTNSSGVGTLTTKMILSTVSGQTRSYMMRVTWVDISGATRTVDSNAIPITWGGTSAALEVRLSLNSSQFYLNETIAATTQITGGTPNTSYRLSVERQYQTWTSFAPTSETGQPTVTTNTNGAAASTINWPYIDAQANTPGAYQVRIAVTPVNGGATVYSNVMNMQMIGTTRPGGSGVVMPSIAQVSASIPTAQGGRSTIYFGENLMTLHNAAGMPLNEDIEIGLEWKFNSQAASAFQDYPSSFRTVRAVRSGTGTTGTIASSTFSVQFQPIDAGLAGIINIRAVARIKSNPTSRVVSNPWLNYTLIAAYRP